ncbi:MAG: virulence RhuM family protein [Bacteroidales bacterium]|nr:virulence RhuM family protein [Bacteroidales bacterium]
MDEEIKLYQSEDALVKLEVRIEKDTIWLTQKQMAELYGTEVPAVSKHIKNIFNTNELKESSTISKMEIVQMEGGRKVNRTIVIYNLDMIIAVGYRVNTRKATNFRIWATEIIKEYLYQGYAVNKRIDRVEEQVHSLSGQVQTLLQRALPPTHGIFFDGQIFDAYQFVSDLIRSAKRSIVLFDNYADDSVLTQLAKRTEGVAATVCASRISEGLRLDARRHNCLLVLLHTIPETFFRSADNGRRFFYICGLLILKYHYYAKIYTFHPPFRSHPWFRPR